MSAEKAREFMKKHGMAPEAVSPSAMAGKMAEEMELGLAGRGGSMPMIPTYLKDRGEITKGKSVAVIDAGGTNFRRALVTFTEKGCRLEQLAKSKMPGVESPASWEEFIAFTAEMIMPLMEKADCIGFCFSYSAEILPDLDGRVIKIDKEVTITGSAGKLVAASLRKELESRGVSGKRIVILNDTAAVLLGGLAAINGEKYSAVFGQVSGTGTNTCCALPVSRIGKLGLTGAESIIVNTESGMYAGMPRGDFDRLLDQQSANPGQKYFEKMTAGVYLGELCRLMLCAAAEEDLLMPETAETVRALKRIDSAVIDAWASGEGLEDTGAEDREFIKALCLALFERSARCMCTNIAALLLLTGAGKEEEKPACVCAEGSLVQKGRHYRPMLEALIEREISGVLGLHVRLLLGEDSTMPGSAAAALLNC